MLADAHRAQKPPVAGRTTAGGGDPARIFAIADIVAILDDGDDFKPHTRMMAETIHTAFWNSMPNAAKKKGN